MISQVAKDFSKTVVLSVLNLNHAKVLICEIARMQFDRCTKMLILHAHKPVLMLTKRVYVCATHIETPKC